MKKYNNTYRNEQQYMDVISGTNYDMAQSTDFTLHATILTLARSMIF